MSAIGRIVIRERKYKDDTVLVAMYKVRAKNRITFLNDREFAGKSFTCDGIVIRGCPIVSNGVIDCYAVPIDRLEPEN